MTTRVMPTRNDIFEYTEAVTLDGETYLFFFKHNLREDSWTFDISEVDGTPIRHGVKLVTGFPLLVRVASLTKPGGEFFVVDTTGKGKEPTISTLNAGVDLLYTEEADL